MIASQTPVRLWVWPDTIDSLYSSVCRESDFKPDENREGYVLYSKGDLTAVTAERDALVGAAYEAAAKCIQSESGTDEEADYKAYLAGEVRALTPADATTALDHMLTKAKAEGREKGMQEAATIALAVTKVPPQYNAKDKWRADIGADIWTAILAAAEKEAGK